MSRARIAVASLALSASALVGIALHEGYRGDAYLDSVKVPTIGFGTTEGVEMGDRITPPKALERALRDAQQFEGALKRCVTVPLHQWEYDALIQFSYNVGSGAFCGSTLVKKLNAGQYREACDELLRWTRAGGRVLPGLVKRRAAEHRLCIGEAN